MQPEKYLRDLESSQRRKTLIDSTILSLLFLTSFLFLGPLIHEASHIAVLHLYDCFYRFSPNFSIMSGLHARVNPLCNLETGQLGIFYAIGYISTLLTAAAASIAAIQDRKGSRCFAAFSSGLFLSILLSIGAEGDIQSLVDVLGLSRSYSTAAVAVIVLGVFISSLKTIELFLDLEREE